MPLASSARGSTAYSASSKAAAPALAPGPLTKPYVRNTLVLTNGSVVPGNFLATDGGSPVDVAYDGSRGEVFVATPGSLSPGPRFGGTVTVVSDSTDRVLATVPVSPNPSILAYDSGRGEVFVGGPAPPFNHSSNITVLSDSTNSTVATIPVPSGPASIAYDVGKGELFVTNSTRVLVVSDSSNAVIATIRAGTAPTSVAYDSDRGEVFVASVGNVSVISDATDAVVATIPLACTGPMTYDSGKGEVFVLCSGSYGGGVAVISDASDTVVATVGLTGDLTGITYDSGTGQVFVANSYSWNVAIISDSNDTVVRAVALVVESANPQGLTYDNARGEVFVADSGQRQLSAIYDLNDSVENVFLTAVPDALAYDSARSEMFIADEASNTVDIISDTTDAIVAAIRIEGPVALSYDSGTGQVFVLGSVFSGTEVSVVSDATNTVVASTLIRSEPGPGFPGAAVYDSGKGEVFITEPTNVEAISDVTDTVVATIDLNYSPTGLAYDRAKGELFASGDSDNVSVVSDVSNSVVANIPVASWSVGAAYDSGKGEVFVSTVPNVKVISDSTDRVVATVPIPALLNKMEYDSARGLVITTDPCCDTLSVISDSTNSITATVAVGAFPVGIVHDSGTGEYFVANAYQGTVSVVAWATFYTVTLTESGLPSALTWQVSVNRVPESLTTNGATDTLTFLEQNGTYSYSITDIPGYHQITLPYNGNIVVSGGSVAETTLIYAAVNTVTFAEVSPYLPPGESWSVAFHGIVKSSTGTSAGFAVPNGTFPYLVTGPPGWEVSSPSPEGLITVNGTDVNQAVTFMRATTFGLTFQEVGLASGTRWCVTIGAPICSTMLTVSFKALTPATYRYTLGQFTAMTTLVKVGGVWVVETGGVYTIARTHDLPAHNTVQVRFAYPVTFIETGLTGVFTWAVTAQGETGTSTTNIIELNLTNGTQRYTVHPVPGYLRAPASGRLMVTGGPLNKSIAFRFRMVHEPGGSQTEDAPMRAATWATEGSRAR